MDKQRVIDAAQAAMRAAMAAGAEWAEAAAAWGRHLAVDFERNSIRRAEVEYEEGIGVRAYVNGAMGTAVTNAMDASAAREVGEEATELARAATRDPDFKRLPEPQELAEYEEPVDERIAGLPAEELVRWCREAIERGRATADKVFLMGGASAGVGVGAVVSSTGVCVAEEAGSVSLFIYASVWRGDKAASFADGTAARRMEDFEWEELPEKVVRRAEELIEDRPVKTGRYDVVIDFKPAYAWLRGVVGMADAESVQRGRCFMVGKEGEQIASEVLTIVEDPFVPGGLRSGAFDGEGMARVKRKLVDRGILTTYLHNSYTAFKAGVQPTGHAARGGYTPHVGIGMSNLLVQPGEKKRDELIAEINTGILVVAGAPTPDPSSGQISATIDGGFVIRDGQVGPAVKGAMMVGEIFEWLGRIDAVSADYEEEPGALMPAVRVRDVKIAGE